MLAVNSSLHFYLSFLYTINPILLYFFNSTGANVYYTLQDFPNAIADCEKAIQIDPNFTKVSPIVLAVIYSFGVRMIRHILDSVSRTMRW